MTSDPNPGEQEPVVAVTPGMEEPEAGVDPGASGVTESTRPPASDGVSQTAGIRYVVQRTGSGRNLGEITSETDAGLTVVISGSTFQWERLPNSVHEVAEGSLELDSFLGPQAVRDAFEQQPADVVARLLKDRLLPLEAGDIQRTLEAFEILPAGEAKARWKDLQKSLVKHPNIRREGKPVTYAWSDEPVVRAVVEKTERSVADLIDLVAKPTAKGRADAIRELAEKDERGELSPTQRQVAVALGGIEGDRGAALAGLDLAEVSASVAPAVVRSAADSRLWPTLLRFAADQRASVSAAAVSAFGEAPLEDQRVALVDWFSAAQRDLTAPGGQATQAVQRWLRVAQALMPLEPDATVGRAVLSLAIAVADGYFAQEVRVLLVEELLALLAAHGANPGTLVSAVPQDRRQVEAFHQLLRNSTGARQSGRVFWYRVALRSNHVDMFERDGSFNLLDLDGLSELFGDPEMQALLGSRVAMGVETRLRTLVDLAPLPDLLAFIEGVPGVLAGQIRPDRLAERLGVELESDSLLSKALAKFAAQQAGQLESRLRAEMAEDLEEHGLRLQAANDRLAVLEADLAAQKAARTEAENRIVQLSRQSREAASHGLEQARLDALRAVASIVEDLRRVAAGPDDGVLSASDLHLAASTQAQVLGVGTLEQAGDTVPFDPTRHRLIDQARPQDGTPQVRVIEPTYAVRTGDSVTVLRYGRVTGS